MTFELHRTKISKDQKDSFPLDNKMHDETQKPSPKAWPIELRERAVEEFDAAECETTEFDSSLDLVLAKRFEENGRLEEAEKIYRVLSKMEQNFENLSCWAGVLYKLERDSEAQEVYLKVLNYVDHQADGLFDVYKNIGNLAVKSQDLETAEEYFNKAYTIDSESDVLMVNYGTLGIQRFEYDTAAEYFKKALEINCKNDRAWVGLALIHYSKSDIDLAWANALKALDCQPGNRTAIGLLAQWASSSAQMSVLIDRLYSYLAIEDQDGGMSLLLVRMLLATGQIDIARIEVERAFQICDDPREAFQIRSQIDQLSRSVDAR